MKSASLSGCVTLLILLVARPPLQAQSPHADSVRRNDCHTAAQELAAAHPSSLRPWAFRYIGYCPAEVQSRAISAALTRSAAAGDVRTFQRLAGLALFVPDDGLLDQLLAVVTTASRPEPIRLAALITLARLRSPERAWDVADYTEQDYLDCPTRTRSDAVEYSRFRPRPATFLHRLEAARAELAADTGQPASMRRLARCM